MAGTEASKAGSSSFDVAGYWDDRYRKGGKSGRGSYGRLAEFKAEVVNDLFKRLGTRSVLELGCGDGNQLSLYSLPEHYVGLDISPEAVRVCRERFGNTDRVQFFTIEEFDPSARFDMVMSIDVIFHLVVDDVFDSYMRTLVRHADRHLLIYSSNYEARTKDAHVRHRRFETWLEENAPQWKRKLHIRNRYPRRLLLRKDRSACDFYLFERIPV